MHLFQFHYRLTLAGLVRSALTRSYHPLLSKTKHRAVYDIVPQEQPSLRSSRPPHSALNHIPRVPKLTHRTTFKKGMHSNNVFTYTLRFFCGARRSRWGRTVLERISSALWSTLGRKGGTSHNDSNAGGMCMQRKDNTTVTLGAFCSGEGLSLPA